VARGRRAQYGRNPNPDPAVIEKLTRDLKFATCEAFLERILAEAPPLTEAQRSDLAALLVPVGGDA
jgi:hypothetical protein